MLYLLHVIVLLLLLVLLIRIALHFTCYDFPGFKVFYKCIGRDLRVGFRLFKVKEFAKKCVLYDLSIGDIFQDLVKRCPQKTCFIYEDQVWSYQKVEDYSNQVANAFLSAGYQKGDEVALFMENCPEYVCIWLGLSKIGVVSALINTNQRLHSLAHSINVVNAKAIIFNADLASAKANEFSEEDTETAAVRDVTSLLDNKNTLEYYCLGKLDLSENSLHVKDLSTIVQEASRRPVDKNKHHIGFNDRLLYIYTSGTTGLPKAAIIRHSRYILVGSASHYLVIRRTDDIFYNTLPLYHSAGGMFFMAAVLMFGGTMVIKKKFSASSFWKDAVKYNATVSQYIGEICRFLLCQPRKPEDTQHKMRLICGNGLRPQIWREFKERFQIEEIVEIYGATEGNANAINVVGKVGAVGFLPRLFSRLYPVQLVRIDPKTGEPIRNEKGLCIPCKPGEPGQIIGKIIQQSPVNSFDGYVNPEATKKKVIRDCFEKGDKAFVSGDLLVMDEEGFLYFMDRTGDTFRWRGENVSSTEVEGIISKVLSLSACVVYGVEVPGSEGRAGMAAIQFSTSVNIDALYAIFSTSLPSYAVPIFIRVCESLESTGTYKLRKVDLQKEAYDIDVISDPIYFLHPQNKRYVRLDKDLFNQIKEVKMRL